MEKCHKQNQEIKEKLRKIYLRMKKSHLKIFKGAPTNKCGKAQQLNRKVRWLQNETV